MSTLTVTRINTEDNVTSLILTTGNNSASITIGADDSILMNGTTTFTKNLIANVMAIQSATANIITTNTIVAQTITANGITSNTIVTKAITSNGITLTAQVASSNIDLTKHISLYGSTYGFNITEASVNYNSFVNHRFRANGVEVLTINATGALPGTSNTYDLGTSTLRWRTIYTNDLSLQNEFGDYTIVEGEDDLFLYNNKKNKVYKFALIEVDPSVAPPKKE